ncbi:hypothetical protein LCGC14_2206200 [marine sediment metagenome]|uniref:IrrE N-terminal-like domain-containing protein n=1 Tax=marine sediment metagenome TaxID=412755 RepID=A0A0F9E2K5_9ZZZZ
MKKLTRKQCSQRLYSACFKWLKLLWVGDFDLLVRIDDLKDEEKESSGFKIDAKSSINTPYKLITIVGDEESIRTMNDRALDETACHEILHIILDPLHSLLDEVITKLPKSKHEPYTNWTTRELESTTTHLTNVVRALYRAPKGK